jgi:hypothetical protein
MKALTENFINMFKESFSVIYGEPEPSSDQVRDYIYIGNWEVWQVWSSLAFLQAVNAILVTSDSGRPIKFPDHLNDAYTFFRKPVCR